MKAVAFFTAGLACGIVLVASLGISHRTRAPHTELVRLTHACSPVYTGGGVTICAQPTAYDLALNRCLPRVATIHQLRRCVQRSRP